MDLRRVGGFNAGLSWWEMMAHYLGVTGWEKPPKPNKQGKK